VALKIIMLIKPIGKMLTNDIEAVDLVTERSKLKDLIPAEVQEYFYNDKNDLYEMHYPVLQYPTKV
jgi:hypothetical protein